MAQEKEGTFILKDNLLYALKIAISRQEIVEKQGGYLMESALLAGWKANLKILIAGEIIEVR